jgi:imidazoleglycerol phosphate synthase glutamine amidotransferase subunit HisH
MARRAIAPASLIGDTPFFPGRGAMRNTTRNLKNRRRKQKIQKKLQQQAKQRKKEEAGRKPAAP